MSNPPRISAVEIAQLRERHYNAQVEDVKRIHDDLMILRIRPDRGPILFRSGQYTLLGLGYWEPRRAGTQDEQLEPDRYATLVKRPYSISHGLLDVRGRLLRAQDDPVLEFYIALVAMAARPPALTPRLFLLSPGDRLFMAPSVHGRYNLDGVDAHDNVVFASTGTGEAPHNAMLADLLMGGHQGQIVAVTCVRWKRDLAYLEKHRVMERQYSNYRYLALTTREPENVDRSRADYVGKKYLQDYFASGDFERAAGLQLDSASTHVFLCGSPEMIGVPHSTHDPARRYPSPRGMVEVLEGRGSRVDQPHEPGNIHFEKYW
jgi:ferredoxin--NADP+ reductase